MQVGSFHECYCTDKKGLDLIKLAAELDVSCPLKMVKNKYLIQIKNVGISYLCCTQFY